MVSIGEVEFQLREGKFALTHVSYTLRGSRRDVRMRQAYSIEVRLIGDDQGSGEDGVDDRISGGDISFERLIFENRDPVFRRHSELFGGDADEDPGFSGLLPAVDELRAVVTITELPANPIVGESNVVHRGGLFPRFRLLQNDDRSP